MAGSDNRSGQGTLGVIKGHVDRVNSGARTETLITVIIPHLSDLLIEDAGKCGYI